MIAARLRAVDKDYVSGVTRTEVLRGMDLDISTGALTLIAGPSGCGKSTLLRLLAGLDLPDAGTVEVNGEPMSSMNQRSRRRLRARHVSYVFQNPVENLIEDLTVEQQIDLAARLRGIRRVDRLATLEPLGIGELAGRYPRQLSGGQQQRVALAAASVGRPALLVADEPTAELDTGNGRAVLRLLRDMAGRGQAIVLASHDAAAREEADVVIDMVRPGGRR